MTLSMGSRYFFLAVFTIECILKIIARGFGFGRGAFWQQTLWSL